MADEQSRRVYRGVLRFYHTGEIGLLDEITIDKDGGNVNVKAQAKITLEAPTIELKGSLQMGNSTGSGTGDTMKITGNLDVTGSVKTDGNVTAGHFYGPVN